VAVCVSKCDQYIADMDAYLEAMRRPRAFLRELIGTPITDALAHYFACHELFALSAAGLRLRHGIVEPGVFYDEALELRLNFEARPFNLLPPLIWLLERLEQ
jgi:hypothetical protein